MPPGHAPPRGNIAVEGHFASEPHSPLRGVLLCAPERARPFNPIPGPGFAVDCSDVRSIRPVGPSARVSRRAPESSDNVYQRTNLPARAITGTSRNHRHAYARCDHKSSEECMHRGWTLGWVAFMILCSPGANVTAAEEKHLNAIRVLEATYGGNCEGVAKGNVTKFIASACDGADLCNYRVYYKNMGGDPAAGCKKAFRVTYVCGKNTKNPETCALEAEAGKGGDDGEPNNFCLLHCLSEGSRERRKAK